MAQVTIDLTLANGSATPPELFEVTDNWWFDNGHFRSAAGAYSELQLVNNAPDSDVTLHIDRREPGVANKSIRYEFRRLDANNMFRLSWNMDFNGIAFTYIEDGVSEDIDNLVVGSATSAVLRIVTSGNSIKIYKDGTLYFDGTDERNVNIGGAQVATVEGFYGLTSVSFTEAEAANNIIPIAVIGASRNINTNFSYTADVSGSYDPNGSDITYLTTLTTVPAGSSATVIDGTTTSPSFTPDVDGEYVLSVVVNDGTDDSEPATQTLTASLSAVLPSKMPQTLSGFALTGTKLGSLPTHPALSSNDNEYWAWPVDGSLINDWPHEQYPMLLYTSTDHDLNGDGAIILRVWDKSRGDLIIVVDGEEVLNNAALVGFEVVSNLPEFDHITQKTNPIFVDTGKGFQTETPSPIVVNGEVILYYHNQGVSLDTNKFSSLLYQTTKYVTGTNGVDFSDVKYPGIEYNAWHYAGDGHDGYKRGGLNVVESLPYVYVGRALHGGGGATRGASYQYIGSNDGKNWERINTYWLQRGQLKDDPLFTDGVYLAVSKIDNMKREGAYYRTTGTVQVPAFGTQSGYAIPVEILLDERLMVVSYAHQTMGKGASGTFDDSSVGGITEIEIDGIKYGFYTGRSSVEGVQEIGVAKLVEEPYDWTLFATNAERAELINLETSDSAVIPNLTYTGTAEHSVWNDGPFLTRINLEMGGSVSGFLSNDSITLSDHSMTEIYFDYFGKNTETPQAIKIGLADAVTGSSRELAIYLPATTATNLDDARSEPMQLSVVGAYNDGNTPTDKYFGQSGNWINNNKDESPQSKLQVGLRIIPALNQLIFLDGLGVLNTVDITGFDYETPIKIFGSGYYVEDPVSTSAWSLGGIKAYSYTDNAIAVPDSPTLTTARTADSVTLTASNVAGATGYKYFLDGKEQDNGVFTVLEAETEYTVYARASNALGDSAPSTISTVTTTSATPVNTKPAINSFTGPQTASAGNLSEYVVTATDPENDSLSYEFTVDSTGPAVTLDTNGNECSFTAVQNATEYNVTITARAFDGELYSDPVSITNVVNAYVPPVVTPGDVRNLLELKATLLSGTQEKPLLNSSSGALFKGRDARITIEVDGGGTDVSNFEESVFQLFKLAGSEPLISKSTDNGVSYVDNKIEILITAAELNFSGRHYFETIVVKNTQANLLSGYITVVNSRVN